MSVLTLRPFHAEGIIKNDVLTNSMLYAKGLVSFLNTQNCLFFLWIENFFTEMKGAKKTLINIFAMKKTLDSRLLTWL